MTPALVLAGSQGVLQHQHVTATEERPRDVLSALAMDEDSVAREPHVPELLGQHPVRVSLIEGLIDWIERWTSNLPGLEVLSRQQQ